MSKLRLRQTEDVARQDGPHERGWWEKSDHPERSHLLRQVLWEKMEVDSEDGMGKKLYIKERCPKYEQLLQEIERKKAQAEQR